MSNTETTLTVRTLGNARIWKNERVWSQLINCRMQAVASGNQSYAALLSTIIDRVEKDI